MSKLAVGVGRICMVSGLFRGFCRSVGLEAWFSLFDY